jgi:hypothetical protein
MGNDVSVLSEGEGDLIEEDAVAKWTESCGVGVVGTRVPEALVLTALSQLPGEDRSENGSTFCAGEGAEYRGLNRSCSSSSSSIMTS